MLLQCNVVTVRTLAVLSVECNAVERRWFSHMNISNFRSLAHSEVYLQHASVVRFTPCISDPSGRFVKLEQ